MKKTLALFLSLLTVFSFCACAKQSGNVKPDMIIQDLIAGGYFSEELSTASKTAPKKMYGIENAEESLIYVGSGATAEEFSAFRFADPKDAENAKALAQAHIQKQIDAYSSYRPSEVPKLSDAYIKVCGNWLIVCVSANDVHQTLNNMLK